GYIDCEFGCSDGACNSGSTCNPSCNANECEECRNGECISTCEFGVEFCNNGECTRRICNDSDGGNNEFVQGTVTANFTRGGTDSCVGSDRVYEYYCDTDLNPYPIVRSGYIDCEFGCSDGACNSGSTCNPSCNANECEECRNGECISKCNSHEFCSNGNCIEKTCTDSDGMDAFTKGTVTLNYNFGGSNSFTDFCSENNGITSLGEYVCSGVIPAVRGINCELGCRDGACVHDSGPQPQPDPVPEPPQPDPIPEPPQPDPNVCDPACNPDDCEECFKGQCYTWCEPYFCGVCDGRGGCTYSCEPGRDDYPNPHPPTPSPQPDPHPSPDADPFASRLPEEEFYDYEEDESRGFLEWATDIFNHDDDDGYDEDQIILDDWQDYYENEYPEISEDQVAAIVELNEMGVITGDGDTGDLRPADPVNRIESIVMFNRAFDIETDEDPEPLPFGDTEDNSWYHGYLDAAIDEGMVNPNNPDFRPSDTLNLAETLKLLTVSSGYAFQSQETNADNWYDPYVDIGISLGITDPGDDVSEEVTRGEFAEMLSVILD
ncbi:hypothetical protein HOF56_04445, partial [Candidatus Peribacteria bacterium]|nr:hypothetical protein [Candidatus Peribacteria bacterium]